MTVWNNPGLTKVRDADGALPKFRMLTTGAQPGTLKLTESGSDVPIAANQELPVDDREPFDAVYAGLVALTIGEAIPEGAEVAAGAEGKIFVATAGDYVCGHAFSAGTADGTTIPVVLRFSGVK